MGVRREGPGVDESWVSPWRNTPLHFSYTPTRRVKDRGGGRGKDSRCATYGLSLRLRARWGPPPQDFVLKEDVLGAGGRVGRDRRRKTYSFRRSLLTTEVWTVRLRSVGTGGHREVALDY